jgi:methyl-accepting chemotaxis protein
MSEISHASQEQSIGIQEVSQALGQMDGMTQQNTALVEEASAAAEELKEQAIHLSDIVGQFKLDASTASVSHLAAQSDSHIPPRTRSHLRLANG